MLNHVSVVYCVKYIFVIQLLGTLILQRVARQLPDFFLLTNTNTSILVDDQLSVLDKKNLCYSHNKIKYYYY